MVTCRTCRKSITQERWKVHRRCEDCVMVESVEDAIRGIHIPRTMTTIALPFPDSEFMVEVDRKADLRPGDSVQIDRWIFYVLRIALSGAGTYNLMLSSSHQIPLIIPAGVSVISLRRR